MKQLFYSLSLSGLSAAFLLPAMSLAQVQITFNVNMVNEVVDPDGVFLETSMGWGTPIQMTNTSEAVYSVTLPVPSNQEFQYKFKNGSTFEANAASSECGYGANRIYTSGTTDENLPTVCYGGFCHNCPTGVYITFQVSMAREGSIAPEGVFIVTSLDWDNPVPMILESGSIYRAMIYAPVHETIEYKFLNGNVPEADAQSGCNSGPNRVYTVGIAPATVPLACFGGYCGDCPTRSDITFRVNMSNETIDPSGVFIETSTAWGQPVQMTNVAGDVYAATVSIPNNLTFQYKFKNGPTFEANADPDCNAGANRVFTAGITHTVLPIVCYGGLCTDCQNLINVIFRVDMSREELGPTDTVTLNGNFNNWCGACAPMTLVGDNTWELTVPLSQNTSYEYKYAIGAFVSSEQLQEGDSCTHTTGEFTNRLLETVTGPLILPEVCYGHCASCDQIPLQAPVTFIVNMSDYPGSLAEGIFLAGDLNNWCGTCNPMTDRGNGVYSTTLLLDTGAYEFKFLIGNFSVTEDFNEGTPCTVTHGEFTNRYVHVPGPDSLTVGPYFWNTCDSVSTVGVESVGKTKVKLSPNPVTDQLSLSSEEPIHAIDILSLTGEIAYSAVPTPSFTQSIPTGRLSPGVYILRITTAKNVSAYRIVRL